MRSEKIAELERLVESSSDFPGSYYGHDMEFHIMETEEGYDIFELLESVGRRRKMQGDEPLVKMQYTLALHMSTEEMNKAARQGAIRAYQEGRYKGVRSMSSFLKRLNLIERYEEMGASYLRTLEESEGVSGEIIRIPGKDKYSLILHSYEKNPLVKKGKSIIEAAYE